MLSTQKYSFFELNVLTKPEPYTPDALKLYDSNEGNIDP